MWQCGVIFTSAGVRVVEVGGWRGGAINEAPPSVRLRIADTTVAVVVTMGWCELDSPVERKSTPPCGTNTLTPPAWVAQDCWPLSRPWRRDVAADRPTSGCRCPRAHPTWCLSSRPRSRHHRPSYPPVMLRHCQVSPNAVALKCFTWFYRLRCLYYSHCNFCTTNIFHFISLVG